MDTRAQGRGHGGPGTSARPEETAAPEIWRDPSHGADERVADLLARMTLGEKLAQLSGIWPDGGGDADGVAPGQGEFTDGTAALPDLIRDGLGQLTRVFGTRPVPAAEGIRVLADLQAQVAAANRFGIPAIAHEECLTGFAAWQATAFPTPLAWGASFDPGLIGQMATAIAESMRAVGVHQGLAPVLDVARDARWGRVEETIGEDPYLVGSIGAAYVRGLQSGGIDATLKHFAGYAASRAARNMAPVSMGPREFADVILPPFEMAIRLGGARSVMPSYADVDGMPASADPGLLTRILRDELGFDGVVVSDYYAVSFLESKHGVAGTLADAAALALAAGVDVELPMVRCYGEPLAEAARDGRVPASLVDRAAARVLRQKCDLGLLDADWSGPPGGKSTPNGALGDGAGGVDLDPPAHRALARRVAEESVILLANDGAALPLGPSARIAVVGPLAPDPLAFFGCYTFPRHVGHRYPQARTAPSVTPLLDALREELPAAQVSFAPGCDVRSADRSGIPAATSLARSCDVTVAVLGDEAGLFGRGTSGEGCDVQELSLPGLQEDLLQALVETGTPVVLVLVTGRPYAIGPAADRLAATVQAFFPGEEGGPAIAGVLSGRVVPSGRLPVEMPRSRGAQPSSYLRPALASRQPVSSVDPTPLFAFGHGLSYTTFAYAGLTITPAPTPAPARAPRPGPDPAAPQNPEPAPALAPAGGTVAVAADGAVDIACTVRNVGDRAGVEVVQLYLSDPVAQVVRPARWLAGFARLPLEPGESRRVTFRVHADRTAFHGRSGQLVVEPGDIAAQIGGASDNLPLRGSFTLTGPERSVGAGRVLTTPVTIEQTTS